MTEDEMKKLIIEGMVPAYMWQCPLCSLQGDTADNPFDALEDLRYHINEDHKGED